MSEFQRFGVVGAGAWGTALALALWRAGRDVSLWAHEKDVVANINNTNENKVFLPGVHLDPQIKATDCFDDIMDVDALLFVAPVQHTRRVAEQFAARMAALGRDQKMPIVICSKGIEQGTLVLPSSILGDVLPDHPLAVLSGPTFAAEVARDKPTALTLACEDEALGAKLVQAISSRHFRTYLSNDLIGAQVGGAVKNILAIACGIVTGCHMGDNARAALMTRGLAELTRLTVALGGRPETLMGLSGLGDLVLTCSGMQSRNMSLGLALGQGKSLQEVLSSRSSVAEGVFSTTAAKALAEKLGVEMPITFAMDAVLNQGASVSETIAALLARPLRSEGI